MGALGKLINLTLFLFFAVLAVFLPLIDGQILVPGIYPKFLTESYNTAAALGDMIGSGKVSNRLLLVYLVCMGFWILAILRGLVSHSAKRSTVLARRKLA